MATGDPLKGTSGLCQIGAVSSEVEVKYVTDYELKKDVQTTEDGPFINLDTIDEIAGGVKDELTVNCKVREGAEPGRAAVIAKIGLRDRFVFTADLGVKITIASGLVKSAGVKHEAKSGQVFSFTVVGAAVLSQDS